MSGDGLDETELQRRVLEASPDLVFVKDRHSSILWANRAYLRFMGASLEAVRSTPPPKDGATVGFLIDDRIVFETGRPVEIMEHPAIRHDGQTRWFHTVKSPIHKVSGRPLLLVALARDVTELRATGRALDRLNEGLLGFGADSLDNINRLVKLCGKLLGADSVVYSRLEKGLLSAVGHWNMPADFNPVSPAAGTLCEAAAARAFDESLIASQALASPFTGEPSRCAARAVRSQARVLGALCVFFHDEPAATPLLHRLMGIVASAIAVEEERLRAEKIRSRLAEELRQTQKLEALGRLAGGIAHDFNNTLTAIKGYAELLAASAPDPGPRADAAEIIKAADFAAALTRQLLAFGRQQMLVPAVIDLNEVLRSTASMLKRLIGENIELAFQPCATQARVFADSGQMEQVLINLTLNARDAMPDGGRLTLSLAEVGSESLPAEESPPPLGRYVALTATDTGVGISPELLARVFEPFFTTKELGRGTGLGLATVHGIVAQSGGRVCCESAPGQGATFRIFLPVCRAPLSADSPSRASAGSAQGRGAILLVEDDAAIRGVLSRALRAAGYEVLCAAEALEALSLAAAAARLDALVTDIVMPGMNGRQLALRLEKQRPQLRVLYMSGYTDDAAFRSALRPGTAFLQKPFTPFELCRKLNEVLAAPSGDGKSESGISAPIAQ